MTVSAKRGIIITANIFTISRLLLLEFVAFSKAVFIFCLSPPGVVIEVRLIVSKGCCEGFLSLKWSRLLSDGATRLVFVESILEIISKFSRSKQQKPNTHNPGVLQRSYNLQVNRLMSNPALTVSCFQRQLTISLVENNKPAIKFDC